MYTLEITAKQIKPLRVSDLKKGDIARIINSTMYPEEIVLVVDHNTMISLKTQKLWNDIDNNPLEVELLKSGECVILIVQ